MRLLKDCEFQVMSCQRKPDARVSNKCENGNNEDSGEYLAMMLSIVVIKAQARKCQRDDPKKRHLKSTSLFVLTEHTMLSLGFLQHRLSILEHVLVARLVFIIFIKSIAIAPRITLLVVLKGGSEPVVWGT